MRDHLLEIFPQFVAALFLVQAARAARLLYAPAYAFTPPGARPIRRLAAQVVIFTIVADLFVRTGRPCTGCRTGRALMGRVLTYSRSPHAYAHGDCKNRV